MPGAGGGRRVDWGHSIVMWRAMSERPPGDAAAAVAGDPLTGWVIVRVGPAAAAAVGAISSPDTELTRAIG